MTIVGNKKTTQIYNLKPPELLWSQQTTLSSTYNAVNLAKTVAGDTENTTTKNTMPQWELISAGHFAEKEAPEQGKGELILQSWGSACGQTPAGIPVPCTPQLPLHSWGGHPACPAGTGKPCSLVLGVRRLKVKYPSWTGTAGTKAQTMTFISNPCAGANAFSKHVDMHHWKRTMLLPLHFYPPQPFL